MFNIENDDKNTPNKIHISNKIEMNMIKSVNEDSKNNDEEKDDDGE